MLNRTTRSFILQFLKENLLLITSFPSPNHSPTLRPVLPGITLQINYLHSNLFSWSDAGTQPKTNTITNCDSRKEGERGSANIPWKCRLKWQWRRRSYLVWIIKIQQSKQKLFWKFYIKRVNTTSIQLFVLPWPHRCIRIHLFWQTCVLMGWCLSGSSCWIFWISLLELGTYDIVEGVGELACRMMPQKRPAREAVSSVSNQEDGK